MRILPQLKQLRHYIQKINGVVSRFISNVNGNCLMNQNLHEYVKVYKQQIDSDICDLTVSELSRQEFALHSFYYEDTDEYKSNPNELSSNWNPIMTQGAIIHATWTSILNYVSEFNFKWWHGWQGHTMPKYNKYEVGTEMKEHCDHIKDMFDGHRRGIPILSVVGSLNNEYSGGEFVMFGDRIYELDKGDIIVFPSNFMYPHKVNPVTNGIRYSYASWVW
jgi:hypothetical protein